MNHLEGRILTVAEKEKDGLSSLIAEPKINRVVEETLKATKAIRNSTERTERTKTFKSELKIFNFASYTTETNDNFNLLKGTK